MAGRKRSRAGGGGKPKVPCQNPGICGNTKNHIVGTFTQRRCEEVTRRRAAGEEISADNVMSIRPPGMSGSSGKDDAADAASTRMGELKEAADAWKDSPQKTLDFVRWSQNFTDYSPFNRLMIRMQNPDATRVAGARKWEEMGREVNAENSDIAIFAPGYRPERAKKDDDGKVIKDENGKPVMERVFVNKFRAIKVYDIADTTGDTPPEIETPVMNREALQAVVSEVELSYAMSPSDSVMSAEMPARIDANGKVAYNTATADEDQRLVTRLVATGMAVSAHVRKNSPGYKEDRDKWGQDEHLYAGIAAAWAIGEEAGIDLTDLAVDKMSGYNGGERISTLATHGAKVTDHINTVRQGIPAELADALA